MPERITPACAGKTKRYGTARDSYKDHPRVCGENGTALLANLLTQGSPPRVRGKQTDIMRLEILLRITPACAGKTFKSILVSGAKKDHPRVCGENQLAIGKLF